jgi:hypothetical protein
MNPALWDGNPETEPLYSLEEYQDAIENEAENHYQQSKEDE